MSTEKSIPRYSLFQMLVAEAVGTYALVLVGTGAIVANDVSQGAVTHVGISLCFGLVVAAMIYSLGHISSAHLNPAVTIGFCACNRHPWSLALPYILTQCGAAILASLSVLAVYGTHSTLGATLPAEFAGVQGAFILEIIMTALLMFVILQVAQPELVPQITAGAVIGSVVCFEALFGGPVSGASMNPARSLGPALISGAWQAHWAYWVGPILGALIGVVFHKILWSSNDKTV